MQRALTCPVQLTGASTRADGSLGLRFATPELDPSEKTAFFELLNVNLKLLLQPVDAEPAELKEIKGEFDTKSPSQRLRGVLFVLFKQKSVPGEFEDFYRKQMEAVINSYKKELEPE